MYESSDENGPIHAKRLPFSQFRGIMTEKLPLFLDFGNLLLPPLKKFPLFLQKQVQAWIFFLRFGRGRARGNSLTFSVSTVFQYEKNITVFCFILFSSCWRVAKSPKNYRALPSSFSNYDWEWYQSMVKNVLDPIIHTSLIVLPDKIYAPHQIILWVFVT